MKERFSDIILTSVEAYAGNIALRDKGVSLSYAELAESVDVFAGALQDLGLARYDRVAILSGKRFEYVISVFGVSAAGGAYVPVNNLLKPEQVAHIIRDCRATMIVTTADRCPALLPVLHQCESLRHVVVIGATDVPEDSALKIHTWDELISGGLTPQEVKIIGSDIASIMYTSGSTGKPKGVVLSHTNLLVGASSVANYIGNHPGDNILAVLPFSFDAGLSQLTTGLYSGASVVLHDFFLPGDVVKLVGKEQVTGITGVPPLWIQLSEQNWPEGSFESVRYFANTGGKMPKSVLDRLREIFPAAEPFLMYGLTESFRSTYLPPAEVDNRPDSIGKAIPNAEVLVVNERGNICKPGEVGELVHRGPLVSLGYWNDSERTAERFRPAPGRPTEIPNEELAVWSGDFVRKDEEGFLYFVSRRDEMIKTSGYRVSPSEVEDVVYDSGLASEVVALGLPDDRLGQKIVLVAKAADDGACRTEQLLEFLKNELPNYMVPFRVYWRDELPRNSNGKLDRQRMLRELVDDSADQ